MIFKSSNTNISDWLGITSSVLCLIHCLALPILFISGSYGLQAIGLDKIGFELHEGHFEFRGFNIDFVFAGLAMVAAYFSSKKAHYTYLKVLLWIGWILFILGAFLHQNLQFLMHIGSVLLITTHIQNIRVCRREGCSVDYPQVEQRIEQIKIK